MATSPGSFPNSATAQRLPDSITVCVCVYAHEDVC